VNIKRLVVLVALIALFSSCVLELTWAPVHDAPNNLNLHVLTTPTATATPFVILPQHQYDD
jgi:hypothetical protein